ncbi:(2Fe-2S)-binding protein [Paenibacillus xylaniclasticus]|uniref:(2Fe-2S)-binding protein n=1 Tax=Paenibacillus xylaniclasticus TaxID=588083 RepID=UPI000FD8A782|nr:MULTISPECIES: (2Fe-2S)-binding protein [Paenibacillus]GFN33670.1 ferredoxin [Paenibacillus curdlanolyticus]
MIETSFRLSCTINGEPIERRVPPTRRLLDFIREDIGLTGVKPGCEVGRCGACMVLVDGEPMNACLLMAYQCEGRSIVTIEGVSGSGDNEAAKPHPIQRAIVAEGGLQCGYCTPGIVISLAGLLEQTVSPSREQIEEALSGNLCRCTGYEGIIRAVMRVSSHLDPTS